MLSKSVDRMSEAARCASSDRPHGTSLDVVEECYRALRRAVELSEELALGTGVVVAACHKSPRSKVCRVQPDAWLVDTGSGHDLVDFALVLDSAQLIEPANTASGECRLKGSIIMEIKPLSETSSALVLESTPNALSVGPRCMKYGYSFHWPCGQVPYLVTPDGFQVDCEVENNVPTLLTTHEFPKGFAPALNSIRGGSFSPKRTSRQWAQCTRKRGGGLMMIPPVGAMPPQAGSLSQKLWL